MLEANRIWPGGLLPMISIEKMTAVFSVALVIAIGWTLAGMTWRLFVQQPLEVSPVPAGQFNSSRVERKASNYRDLISLHLFGMAEQPTEVVKPVEVVSAPETTLKLTLRGVLLSEDPAGNVAIIADSEKHEYPYWVGDQLPGQAVIKKVMPLSVLLERNGRLESLSLSKDVVNKANANRNRADRAGLPSSSRRLQDTQTRRVISRRSSVGRVGHISRKLITNPGEILKYLEVEPVIADGHLKGYRVSQGAEGTLFRDVGLLSGDIVTRINGIALNSQDAIGKLASRLDTTQRLIVDVENDGRERKLDLRVDD